MDIKTARLTFPSLEYAMETCKIGQGHDCCRYLTMNPAGFSCEKHGRLKSHLDKRVADNTIVAQGDNCEGLSSR